MPRQHPLYADWQPTGRVRIRSGWFGIAIVEIEEQKVEVGPYGSSDSVSWGYSRWRRMPRGQWTAITWPKEEWGA